MSAVTDAVGGFLEAKYFDQIRKPTECRVSDRSSEN